MLDHGVPAGRMYGAAEMIEDPHFQAREAIFEVTSARWPGLKMQNVFPRLSGSPGSIRTLAPERVGQHNEEILDGILGIPQAERAELAARGVV